MPDQTSTVTGPRTTLQGATVALFPSIGEGTRSVDTLELPRDGSRLVFPRAACAAAVLLGVSVTGCGSGSTASAPASTSSAPGARSDSPTSPTPSGSATPSVAPATGPTLASKGVSVRLPQGWKADQADAAQIQVTGSDTNLNTIYLSVLPSIGSGTSGVVKSIRQVQDMPASSVRPEVTFAGQPFAHLSGVSGGGGLYDDIYGTLLTIDGQAMLVTVSYETDDDAAKVTTDDVDAIMQPVMATLKLP